VCLTGPDWVLHPHSPPLPCPLLCSGQCPYPRAPLVAQLRFSPVAVSGPRLILPYTDPPPLPCPALSFPVLSCPQHSPLSVQCQLWRSGSGPDPGDAVLSVSVSEIHRSIPQPVMMCCHHGGHGSGSASLARARQGSRGPDMAGRSISLMLRGQALGADAEMGPAHAGGRDQAHASRLELPYHRCLPLRRKTRAGVTPSRRALLSPLASSLAFSRSFLLLFLAAQRRRSAPTHWPCWHGPQG